MGPEEAPKAAAAAIGIIALGVDIAMGKEPVQAIKERFGAGLGAIGTTALASGLGHVPEPANALFDAILARTL